MASPYRVRSSQTMTRHVAPSVQAASSAVPVDAASASARIQSVADSHLPRGEVKAASYAANDRELPVDKKQVMSGEQREKVTCADEPLHQGDSASAHGHAASSNAKVQSIARPQLSREQEVSLQNRMWHYVLLDTDPKRVIDWAIAGCRVRYKMEDDFYEGRVRFSTPMSYEAAFTALIRLESRKLASTRLESDDRPVYDMSLTFPRRDAYCDQEGIDLKQAVCALKDEELLSLESRCFLWIVDFLSLSQCIAVLLSDKCYEWKLAIYYYSPTLANAIGARQQEVWNQPVDEEIRQLARAYHEQAAKYCADDFNLLLDRSELLNRMKVSSSTLVRAQAPQVVSQTNGLENTDKHHVCWETTIRDCLPDPKLDQISITWIVEMHARLVQLEMPGDRELRTPGTSVEEIIPLNDFFSPGRIVRGQMKAYCEWLNQELESCRKGSACPIVTAALAYMRFISIHPFIDGNGRMGRLIADSILRSFKLLPAVWNTHKMVIFPFGSDPVVTPTIAVVNMLEALDRSYQLTKDSLI